MNLEKRKGHVKLIMKNQGGWLIGFLVIFFLYFGVMANILMYEQTVFETVFGKVILQSQIHKSEWTEGHLLIWSYLTYLRTFFLPPLILFITCLILTYRQSNPHYGIKSSMWYVPIIICLSFLWHWYLFGLSITPFVLQFGTVQGYINIIILYSLNFSGALVGMKLKQYVNARQEKIEEQIGV